MTNRISYLICLVIFISLLPELLRSQKSDTSSSGLYSFQYRTRESGFYDIQVERNSIIRLCKRIKRDKKFTVCKIFINFNIDTNNNLSKAGIELEADTLSPKMVRIIDNFCAKTAFKLSNVKYICCPPYPISTELSFSLYKGYTYSDDKFYKSDIVRFFQGIRGGWQKPRFDRILSPEEIITDE